MPIPEWGCAWVPDWPLAALRQEMGISPQLPVVLSRAGRVVATSLPARSLGVEIGMRLRVAHALCPELEAIPADPLREVRAFEAVLRDLDQVIASLCVLRPGLVLFPLPGARRHAGGETELAQRVHAAVLDGSGHEVHVGGGGGVLTALLAARADCFVPLGEQQDFLRPYPIAVLNLAEGEAGRLQELFAHLGVRTLGDLASLPEQKVRDRFGELGTRLHQLASGTDTQLRALVGASAPVVEVNVEAEEPIDRADVAAFAARRLALELLTALGERALACTQLEIAARTGEGGELQRNWAFPVQPGEAEFADRVRWQLESWVNGARPPGAQGPLTRLRLAAVQTCPASAAQPRLWETGRRGREAAARSAARAQALLGEDAVLCPVVQPGPDPRSRVRLLKWGSEPEPVVEGTWEGGVSVPAPALLSSRLLPVSLRDAEGEGVCVSECGELSAPPERIEVPAAPQLLLRAGTYLVKGVSWPWQLLGQWWQAGGSPPRAALAVECIEGPSFLLAWVGQQWFLDGVYD